MNTSTVILNNLFFYKDQTSQTQDIYALIYFFAQSPQIISAKPTYVIIFKYLPFLPYPLLSHDLEDNLLLPGIFFCHIFLTSLTPTHPNLRSHTCQSLPGRSRDVCLSYVHLWGLLCSSDIIMHCALLESVDWFSPMSLTWPCQPREELLTFILVPLVLTTVPWCIAWHSTDVWNN